MMVVWISILLEFFLLRCNSFLSMRNGICFDNGGPVVLYWRLIVCLSMKGEQISVVVDFVCLFVV